MKPIAINGDVWVVRTVVPSDPSLVDRTGSVRVATTDPNTRTISISSAVVPPFLDAVLLHEVAHAITESYGLLEPMRANIEPRTSVFIEEWSVGLIERHAVEAIALTSESLGRPLCIRGFCM